MAGNLPQASFGVFKTELSDEEAAKRPYTASDTLNLLKIAKGFEEHPQGALIAQLANQLRKADTEIANASSRVFTAELKVEKAERSVREYEQSIVRLRGELAEARAKLPKDGGEDCI